MRLRGLRKARAAAPATLLLPALLSLAVFGSPLAAAARDSLRTPASPRPRLFRLLRLPSQSGGSTRSFAPPWSSSLSRKGRRWLGARARRRADGPIQVMTDVDDTVKSSGGKKIGEFYLGGIDTRYPRGEFYPGVFQFGQEMSFHGLVAEEDGGEDPQNQGEDATEAPLPMAILTARAREMMAFLEIKPDSPIRTNYNKMARKFATRASNGGGGGQTRKEVDPSAWGVGPVLYGSVREWVFQPLMADRKFENFQLLRDEVNKGKKVAGYVFIGDTGLFDREAGEMMCSKFSDDVLAIFLHDVGPRPPSLSAPPFPFAPAAPPRPSSTELPSDYLCNGVPVLHFKTYIGAAAKAVSQGLLSKAALVRVTDAALEDFRKRGYPMDSRWRELLADAEMARLVLGEEEQTEEEIQQKRDLILASRYVVTKSELEKFEGILEKALGDTEISNIIDTD